MPTKWKIFRIVAIVQIIISLMIIVAMLLSLVDSFAKLDTNSLLLLLLCTFLLSHFFIFPVFNLYILQKNFPDSFLSTNRNSLFLFFFILYCLSSFSLLILYFYGINETIKDYNRNAVDWSTGFQVLIAFTVFIIMTIYMLVQSLKLRSLIKKNAEEKQLAEIDNFFLKD